jgi:hypothetical protein
LLALFFLALTIVSFFRTPGSWSDGRSQWFPQLVMTPVALAFCVAAHWVYPRAGKAAKWQAVFLWVLFGGAVALSFMELMEAERFLSEFGIPGPLEYLRRPSMFFTRSWGYF